MDFNRFQDTVEKSLKARKIKLSASEKRGLYGAVTEYDAEAEKVIRKDEKLTGDKLKAILDYHDCQPEDLPVYGYFPTEKPNVYRTYETSSDLRDTESVPLKENVQEYFLREVRPHVPEAWIDLSKTKVGYEISFNKYFYRHTPLRSLEEVSAEILALERESEGLISEILNIGVDATV